MSDFDFDFDMAPGGGKSEPPGQPGGAFPPLGRPSNLGGEIPDYVSRLNDRQREAVLHTEGPLIVLAGAGSGKTRMLTSRIAYLIDTCRVPPYNILAVTFTNKAAAEMRERVQKSLENTQYFGSPEIGTFHAICVRLLRREMKHTPFTKQFVIYDDADQLSLVKGVVQKLGIDEKAFSPKSLQAAINRAKCDAYEPNDMTPTMHNVFEKQLKRVYEQYQKDLFANNALDFGEIICMAFRILRDNPEVRRKYQSLWRFIHVDEYQDTNRAQYMLLSMLASGRYGGHQNICVVGDEDQSIYKWRGADIRNILDFENDYPGAYVVKLEQNYRSTKTIVTAASQVIKNNRSRKDKTLWTENDEGTPITRYQLPDERAEAEVVSTEIRRIAQDEGRTYNDFAIFYRTHAQSRQFEDVFRRDKIPYKIVGGLRFYDRKEIKDILSYFKVILNPNDSISLKRIINTPARGIGKTTIDKLEALQLEREQRGEKEASLWHALRAAVSGGAFSAGTARKLDQFCQLMDRLIEEQPKLMLSELYHLILDETSYVRELKQENTDESLARIENLEEFDTLLQEFEEAAWEKIPEEERDKRKAELLPIFIEQSTLASAEETGDGVEGPTVHLMTLHSSKGLEYPVVFLPGMEEGLFPSVKAWEETPEEDIEEERRLCYVGMTRAREKLFLLHVVVRRIWGNVTYQEPARFFTEMPANLIAFKDLSGSNRVTSVGSYSGSRRSDDEDDVDSGSSWSGGQRPGYASVHPLFGAQGAAKASPKLPRDEYSQVTLTSDDLIGLKMDHPEYGRGTIVATDGSGENAKVTIEFKGRDRRKFLLRYVKGYIED